MAPSDSDWHEVHHTGLPASGQDYSGRSLGEIGQIRGFLHFSLANRAKSESVETRTQPCSMARAAKCASGTRLATA